MTLFARTIGRFTTFAATALFICFIAAASAQAQTMTVTRNDDRNNPTCAAGDCSLREALTAANASPDVNTIQFSALFDLPQVISLSNGHLTISTSMSITGKGANLTTVSANGGPRVFYIGAGSSNITISGLTIANGDTGAEPYGGGIENQGDGTVNLINSAFTNNRSTVYGSAIYRGSGGTWNITGCTFSGNNAFQGAIYISGGSTNITNTTISGNIARSPYGGGILNSFGTLTITNSTVTANTANGGSVGGVVTGGPTTVKNSIIAGNNGGLDIDGSVNNSLISGGYNFIGKSDGTDGFTNGVNNDQVGTVALPKDPLLYPLASNGGTTSTHALSAVSPAIDKGFSFGSTTDQRGFTRPIDMAAYPNAPGGNGADIGAVETAAPVTFTVTRIDDRNNPTCAVGDCSLREALTAASATFSQDVIQFSALFDSVQTITLTNGQLVVSKSLSILGKGANLTTVSGNNASRVFFIPQSLVDATITGLTIAGGNGNGSDGGGLRNLSTGTVNLTNCAFTNNNSSSGYGGGLEDRSPRGGALNISGCTFSGNSAIEGGAIKIESNAVNVANTTISGNTATDAYGGGIGNYDGTLTISSSTITANTSIGSGFFGSAGGVINISGGATITVRNSIIAGNNGVSPDIGGAFTSNGYNFIGKSDGSSGFTNGASGDQVGTIASPKDPVLFPLSNNGGTTQTHALVGGSPTIDKGSATGTDQRGSNRPVDLAAYANAPGGNASDIGAYEAQTAPAPVSDLTVTKTHAGNFLQGDAAKNYAITVTNSGGAATSGNVSAVDTLPTGLTATSITGTGWTCTLGTLTCTRSDVLAGASSYPIITLTVSVAANAPASVTNDVSVSGGGEINTTNNLASDPTVVGTSDLTVSKSHTGNFTQGDTGRTYSIIVTNSGVAPTSGTVSLVDTLPSGLTATAMTGIGWTCTLPTLTCTRIDALPAGTSYPAITLTVTVANDALASVTNIVSVSGCCEVDTTNNQASDPTSIVALPLIVTRSDDRNNPTCVPGDCSLREVITMANASAEISGIQFSALFDGPQTITLTSQLVINKSMSIVGKGANLTTVSGGNATRIFFIAQNPSNVTISGLTIANGSGGDGGGLRNLSTGVVNLNNCSFANNVANSAYGGAIEDHSPGGGALNITGCTFSGNIANEGGALKIQSNAVNVTNTTISGNTANAYGGGIGNYSGALTLTNSTITGNTANGAGTAGGLVNMSGGATATVKNSIITGNNGVNPDVGGSFVSNGYNFIGKSNGSAGFTDGVNNDQVGTVALPKDPLLLPLGNNGGATRTHAFSMGSPAMDKGSSAGSDQRGLTRPVDFAAYTNAPGGNGADIGAFEMQFSTAAGVSVSGRVLSSNGRGLTNAVVTIEDANGTTRTTRTGRLGNFRFDDVEAGQTYVFSVMSRRYSFAPQVIVVLDDLTGLTFIAETIER